MKTVNAIPLYPLIIRLFFKYNPWLFIVDQIIRIAILCIYLQNYITTKVFILIQILLLVIVLFHHDWYNDKLQKKYRQYITSQYSNRKIEIEFNETVPDKLFAFQALIGFMFSVWFFYRTIITDTWYMYIVIILLACLGTIAFIIPVIFTFRIKQSSLKDFHVYEKMIVDDNGKSETTLNTVTKKYLNILHLEKLNYARDEIVELDSIDYNDTLIAKLESELKSITHKIDAWMLESVFLGGLAFSGFLTVASANFLGKETEVFQRFINHAKGYVQNCFNTSMIDWFNQIPKAFFRNDLYILIMLLCLMSSVFFLLVLTLRLRLNSLTLSMDHLIRIMSIFNAKEEELFNLREEKTFSSFQTIRLEKVSRKTELAINDANKLLKELKPMVTLMSIYRNLAVFLFYVVLIVSGFYFLPIISLIIFSLAIFTQAFRMLETYSKLEKIKNLLRRH